MPASTTAGCKNGKLLLQQQQQQRHHQHHQQYQRRQLRQPTSVHGQQQGFHFFALRFDHALIPDHVSHVTSHTHVKRHTSHVTRHTSHVTRHASRVTRHASPTTPSRSLYPGSPTTPHFPRPNGVIRAPEPTTHVRHRAPHVRRATCDV